MGLRMTIDLADLRDRCDITLVHDVELGHYSVVATPRGDCSHHAPMCFDIGDATTLLTGLVHGNTTVDADCNGWGSGPELCQWALALGLAFHVC